MEHPHFVIAFTGLPQTGKDMIFRKLTARTQSMSDIRGVDRSCLQGYFRYDNCHYRAVDLPGILSLYAPSEDAGIAAEYLHSGEADVIAVTGHALQLERLLHLLKEIICLDQVRNTRIPVILCICYCDEAQQRGVRIDFSLLHDVLQIPVVPLYGFDRGQMDDLKAALHYAVQPRHRKEFVYDCLDFSSGRLANECMQAESARPKAERTAPRHSEAVRTAGTAAAAVLLSSILWLTASWSVWLADRLWPLFLYAEYNLAAWAVWAGMPLWLTGCMVHGVFRAASWVILVLLPPLSLLYPLLGLLEGTGCFYRNRSHFFPFPGYRGLGPNQIAALDAILMIRLFFRSTVRRTLPVLDRAVLAAVPAGIVLWFLGNITYTGPEAGYLTFITQGSHSASLLSAVLTRLDSPARLLGMDGAILAAFLLGFLSRRLILPALLMAYLQAGPIPACQTSSILCQFLTSHGWTWNTVLCTAIFALFHWPCASTCLSLYRQTGSVRWTAAAVMIPTAIGTVLCMSVAFAARAAFFAGL